MAVKNVVFRFTADTSQILRIIDDLNKAIAKTQNSLASFKIAANSKQIEQQLAAINKKLEIQADTKTARRELIELNKEIVRVQKTAAAPVKIGFLDTLKAGLATFGIVATIDTLVDLSKSTVQAAIDFERLTASFRALIGDRDLADQKIKEIQQFALATPFDVTEIAAAAKTLLGYGISANDLLPIIKQLGDVSAASGGDIQRVALAFGQVAAKGKLQGEEIRQLVNIGFNPLQEISKQTGESMAALAKRVEAGKVSFEEVAEAFRIATSEGGRFFELAATLNQTFGGQLQKLSEQINLFKIEVGTALATELRPLVITTSEFFQSLTENAKAIRENVLAMGALKATLAFVISLLFKSANAYVANILSLKTWGALITATQKQIVAFTLALRINTIATGASTTAQKAAAVATTLWDGATKALTVGINFLSGAAKALWATIAANPIGTIIAAYYLWNSLIEENIKKTRENILAQNNLRDARTIIKDYDLQASGAIQAVSGSLEDQRKQIVDAITTNGILSDTAQEYIKRLEEQEKINLSAIKGYKDQSRAIRELNTLFDKLKERKAVEVKVTEAENSLQELRIALGKTDKLFTQFLDARETFGGNYLEFLKQEKERGPIFDNFVSSAEKANTAIGKIKGFFGLPEKINTIPVPLRSQPLKEQRDIYLKLIDEYLNKIKEKENQLADLQTKLFGFGLDRPGKGKEPFKAEKDALADLIKFIQKLKDEIDDLNDKQIEFQIGQMPELSEQDQRAKAYARYDFEVKQNERLKQERIAALNTELEEARKKGASKTKLEELEKLGLAKINQRYAASQLLEYNKLGAELNKINEYWRGEDKRIRDLYLNESIDEELRQRERLTEGLQEDIDNFLLGFEKAPIGTGKRYRETFMGYESALKDSINRQEDLESTKRDLQYFNDKAALEKRYGNEERYANDKNMALLELRTKWEQDSLAIKNKFDDIRFKTDEENTNKLNASEQARLDYLYGVANESVRIATDTANQIIDIEIRKNDVLIELQKKRVEEARDIAEQGNAALLEAEEKRLNELQKKRAKFVRAQQALIFAQTAAESVLAVARAAAAGGPLSPVLVASTIATLVTGFLAAKAASKNAIEGFDKGGWTGNGGRLEPAGIVHKEEFVVKKGPAAKWRPMLEEINRGRDPFLASGVGQQVIMINNVGVEDRLNRIEKAIIGQERMQLTIDESGIHGIVSHYQYKNQRIRNRAK